MDLREFEGGKSHSTETLFGCEDDRERSRMPAGCRVWAGDRLTTPHVGTENTAGGGDNEDIGGVCGSAVPKYIWEADGM